MVVETNDTPLASVAMMTRTAVINVPWTPDQAAHAVGAAIDAVNVPLRAWEVWAEQALRDRVRDRVAIARVTSDLTRVAKEQEEHATHCEYGLQPDEDYREPS